MKLIIVIIMLLSFTLQGQNATQVKNYIERYAPVAVAEMDRCGIPASISMAQAIIESRSGTSVLSIKNNNHFGIKCFSRTCPPGHCTNYTNDSHKNFFIKYKDADRSWRIHTEFLLKLGVKRLIQSNKNTEIWIAGLQKLNYKTDPNYYKKLSVCISQYNLTNLDNL